MNKTTKILLLLAGVILLAYGIYTLKIPETNLSVAGSDLLETQNNTNSYITIGLGIVAVVFGLIKSKR